MRALLVLAALVAAEQFSYEGYKVYRIQPANESQIKFLAAMDESGYYIDFWSKSRGLGKPIDVMVHPSAQNIFVWALIRNGIQYDVFIDNVERVVREERTRQSMAPRVAQGRISFMKYNRYAEINNYLDQLAKDHSDIVSVQTIGKSYEGRDLKVIKISTDPRANKPIIFIDAGIHAREWAAPAQATYIINQLVENSANVALLEKVDWHILPVLNPDGYEYSHTKNRFWRKTRSKGKRCDGTDGNRNFGYHWGETGASSNECDENYMGTKPFSEVESQILRDYVNLHKGNIKLYLTFHSYGQYLLFPWGFTSALPDDNDELQALGESVAKSIQEVNGTVYRVGTSTNVLYPSAGGSDDWVKGVAGVQLSYTIELPGGSFGFDPPPSNILPIVTETWAGIKVYHDYIKKKFGQ